jgi:hypothetical protein
MQSLEGRRPSCLPLTIVLSCFAGPDGAAANNGSAIFAKDNSTVKSTRALFYNNQGPTLQTFGCVSILSNGSCFLDNGAGQVSQLTSQ